MDRFQAKIKRFIFLMMWVFVFWWITTLASVPREYRANYQTEGTQEKISELFLLIEANSQIGVETDKTKFVELYSQIDKLVPHLPQNYKFKLTYSKCRSLTKALTISYDDTTFLSFMENCKRPFEWILSQVAARYTVKSTVNFSPTSWPAPLTTTFDARGSVDPSNETIPEDNYFWYYRDIDGVDRTIGIGSVVNHTFEEAGNYVVHLTVRSSNHTAKWIFDWSSTFSVAVTPKSANINVTANNRLLNHYKSEKFGTQEAQQWILFDGSATMPIGGRKILSHAWKITGPEVNYYKKNEGSPRFVKIPLGENGAYKLTLTTWDNENNEISESYDMVITDPVAIISANPEQWDTSTTISFNSNRSYSIASTLKLITWDIYNDVGEKIDTFQWKEIKKQFKKPGNYTIRLTVEDALWNTNIATRQFLVESSDPIAQFSSKATNKWSSPSEFVLDASLSHDEDVVNGFDSLSYEWSFSDPNNTEILKNEDKNKKITVVFDTIGENEVTLTVKDKFGKINEITKKFNIKSTLRPEIHVSNRAVTWWEYINFVVTSNEKIISYQWDFWDSDTRFIQTNKIKHKYADVGVKLVKLKVYGENDIENEVTTTLFIGDKNSPIPSYIVSTDGTDFIQPIDYCEEYSGGNLIQHPAYQIDRYQQFTINASNSVNAKGVKWNTLRYLFQPSDNETDIFQQNNFNYKFRKIGCKFVDFSLEDTLLGKSTKERVWFKIYNSLPTLDNVALQFPQYGNQMWVGFNQNKVKDIFQSNFNPLIVRVNAVNPIDKDWYVSFYKRYYYRKDDPTRYLERKVTPSSVPYVYFSLPKMPWEFMFGVSMTDNNDGEMKSQDIIGNGPVVVFPPDSSTPDVPIVTVQVDKTLITLWEEVTFDVKTKVLTDRKDFSTNRVIRYDFEGDGKWDLTTKKDRVSYTYTKPSDNQKWYIPRVEVSYRGYTTEEKWAWIIVKDGVKPVLLFDSYDTFSIFRIENIGKVKSTSLCLDLLKCKDDSNSSMFLWDIKEKYFSFDYPKLKKQYLMMKVKDIYANEVERTWSLDLPKKPAQNMTGVHLLSVPQSTPNEYWYDLLVGKNLDNKILYYVKYNWKGECYVDIDITDDKKKDFSCNTLYMAEYVPNFSSINWKIYYEVEGKKMSKNLTIGFLDFNLKLDDKYVVIMNDITLVLQNLNLKNKDNEQLQMLLVSLQKDLINTHKTQANVLALSNFLKTNKGYSLTEKNKKILELTINKLSDKTVVSALWWTEYDQAKGELISLSPTDELREELILKFTQFEDDDSLDYKKGKLQEIWSLFSKKVAKDPKIQQDDEITKGDMNNLVTPNLCKIANYYLIQTTKCGKLEWVGPALTEEQENIKSEKIGMPWWLKVILIILWILVGAFLVMIIVFAIKARMKTDDE